jgi:phenylacetic acid degradation protein PaaD
VQAFSKIGLIPDSGGTYLLPRLIGTARAMGLAVFGDKLPAEQAASWGLIWRCVDDAELPAVIDAILNQLANAPTRGLAATKQAIYAAPGNTLEAQLDLERDLQRELGGSADYREGVAAFAASVRRSSSGNSGRLHVDGRASSSRESRRGAGAGRARGFGDVRARPGFAGAGHAHRARRRGSRRAFDARCAPTCSTGTLPATVDSFFSLADSAFAFACNSYNLTTVASGCTIEFVAPARENDVLTAVARERSVSGRTGVYDIEVSNQDGAAIAFFRGKSYRIKGHVLDGTDRAA